jgi:hypothetical protein
VHTLCQSPSYSLRTQRCWDPETREVTYPRAGGGTHPMFFEELGVKGREEGAVLNLWWWSSVLWNPTGIQWPLMAPWEKPPDWGLAGSRGGVPISGLRARHSSCSHISLGSAPAGLHPFPAPTWHLSYLKGQLPQGTRKARPRCPPFQHDSEL